MAKNMIGRLLAQVAALAALAPHGHMMPRRSELSGKSASMTDERKTSFLGWSKFRTKNQRGCFGSTRAGKACLRKMTRYGYHYHGHLVPRNLRQRITRIAA